MKQKHVFYEVAKNRLRQRLTRLAGAHRLGNISTVTLQTERAKEVSQIQQQLHAYESLRRKPLELENTTFFSVDDWWNYMKSYHPHMCHLCDFFGDIKFFNGTDIRGTFPRMDIVDKSTINPNVHPNCNCLMLRVFRFEA